MGTSGWLVISACLRGGSSLLLGFFWGLGFLGFWGVSHHSPVRILMKTKKQENSPQKTRQKIPQTQNTARLDNEKNL